MAKVFPSGWRELEKQVGQLVQKKRRIAMETSHFDAVPVLDRVPAGVIDLVENATYRDAVVSSGELVSMFYATLSSDQIASHARAAEAIAEIAHEAMQHAGERARGGQPATEHEIFQWIHNAFSRARSACFTRRSKNANRFHWTIVSAAPMARIGGSATAAGPVSPSRPNSRGISVL